MFHKASVRLAIFYLAIIMAISVFFSINLYHVSVQEFDRQLGRQNTFIQEYPGFPTSFENRFLRERQLEYREAKDRVLTRLVLVNLLILVSGGVLSYYLAKRTLDPIERAHEAQSRFTADASHELRTPIAAMRSEIEVALMDKHLTLPKAKTLLNSNLEELEKLTVLSEGLLSLSKMENQDTDFTSIIVNEAVRLAVDRTSALATRKNINITVEMNIEVSVMGNSANITELIVILIENAIKYSPPKTEVKLTLQQQNDQAIITVTDQGQGIAPTDIPHIFERFYRADTARSKEDSSGYGLGLSIAKNIAEKHNGSIFAKSKVNEGTTMTVTLPAVINSTSI